MVIKGRQALENGVSRWTVWQDDKLIFDSVPYKVMWDHALKHLPDDGRLQELDEDMQPCNDLSGQQVRAYDALINSLFEVKDVRQ